MEEFSHNLTPTVDINQELSIDPNGLDSQMQAALNPPELDKLAPLETISPVVTIAQARATEAKIKFVDSPLLDNYFNSQTTSLSKAEPKISFRESTDINETHTQLNSGKYVPKYRDFIKGTDNENRLALEDSTWDRWRNGIGKFAGKTLVNIVDGTLGTVNGIAQGVAEGNFTAVFDNKFSRYLDDVQTQMDTDMPSYMSQEERNMGFIRSMGTANFWANDVGGGLAFTLGAIGTEAVWAAATGGSSLAVTAPKLALKWGGKGLIKALAKAEAKHVGKISAKGAALAATRGIAETSYRNGAKIFKQYLKTVPIAKGARAFNNARFILTSAGFEAGVEARHSLDESLESFIGSYESELGRPPNSEEMAAFMDEAKSNANTIYATNLALVGGSNFLQFGRIFGLSTGMTKSVSSAAGRIFGQGYTKIDDAGRVVVKALKPSKVQHVLGTTMRILEKPFLEGVVEEGGQSVITNASKNWLASRFNLDSMNKNMDAIDAVKQAFHDAYGTQEGRKEVGIGAIIGLLGGGMSKKPLYNMGITKFGADTKVFEKTAEEFEQSRIHLTESAAQTLEKYLVNNSIDSFTEESLQKAAEGDLTGSTRAFDNAQITKMMYEAQAGMLGESVADFEHLMTHMDLSEMQKSGLDVTEANIKPLKEAMIAEYKQNAEDIQQAFKVAEALDPSIKGTELFSGARDQKENFVRNMVLGAKSARRAQDITNTIEEYVGSTGAGSAMKFYGGLSTAHKKGLGEIRGLNNEIANLQDEFTLLQQTFSTAATKAARTTEDGTINKDSKAKLDRIETLRTTILEKQQTVDALGKTLETKFQAGKFAFGGKFNIMQGSHDELSEGNVVTIGEQLAALEELEKLDEYKKALEANGQKSIADNITNLTKMYRESMEDFRAYNTTYEKMVSQGYGKFKGMSALISDALGTSYKEKEKFISEDAKLINKQIDESGYSDDVKFTLKTVNTILASQNKLLTQKELDEFNKNTETVSDEEYTAFQEDPKAVSPDTINTIVDKLANDKDLTPREIEIRDANIDYVNERVNSIKQVVGDDIEVKETPKTISQKIGELADEYKKRLNRLDNLVNEELAKENPSDEVIKDLAGKIYGVEREYLQKKKELRARPKLRDESNLTKFQKLLVNAIEEIKAATMSWSNYNPMAFKESDIPTERNYSRFKALTIKRTTGTISARELAELENLYTKLNSWAKLQGAGQNGVTISQLLERLALSELYPSEAESIVKELETLGELITEQFAERTKGRYYDVLQSYDRAFVSLKDKVYSIHNLSINGLLNIISNTEEVSVTISKDRKKYSAAGATGWNIPNQAEGKVIKITFAAGEVSIKMGEHGRLEITTQNKEKLEALTNFRMLPLGKHSAYSALMKQVMENGKPVLRSVESDITFENGKYKTDTEAIYELKQDDELTVHVAPNDEYNKALREGKNVDKLNVENNLLIYLKDKKGRIVGVFKGISKFTSVSDKNLPELQAIRQSVLQILENTDTTLTDVKTGITVKVGQVYSGHPNLVLQETEKGAAPILFDINKDSMQSIVGLGYIENGKTKWKGKDIADANEFYVQSILDNSEGKYSGKRTPIVAFKYKGNTVVYPAHLIVKTEDFSSQFDEILDDQQTTMSDKILELQNLVLEHGLDINKYGTFTNEIADQKLEELREELKTINVAPSLDDMMGSKESLSNTIIGNVMLNIDLTNEPLHSPKIRVDYKSTGGMVKPETKIEFEPSPTGTTKTEVDAVKKKC